MLAIPYPIHAPSCPCIDCRGIRTMPMARTNQVSTSKGTVPEGRRYFLTVLGRVEFEVDEGEYRRTFSTLFECGDAEANTLLNLSFSHSIIRGDYKDPAKEEVKEDDDRT